MPPITPKPGKEFPPLLRRLDNPETTGTPATVRAGWANRSTEKGISSGSPSATLSTSLSAISAEESQRTPEVRSVWVRATNGRAGVWKKKPSTVPVGHLFASPPPNRLQHQLLATAETGRTRNTLENLIASELSNKGRETLNYAESSFQLNCNKSILYHNSFFTLVANEELLSKQSEAKIPLLQLASNSESNSKISYFDDKKIDLVVDIISSTYRNIWSILSRGGKPFLSGEKIGMLRNAEANLRTIVGVAEKMVIYSYSQNIITSMYSNRAPLQHGVSPREISRSLDVFLKGDALAFLNAKIELLKFSRASLPDELETRYKAAFSHIEFILAQAAPDSDDDTSAFRLGKLQALCLYSELSDMHSGTVRGLHDAETEAERAAEIALEVQSFDDFAGTSGLPLG